MKPSNKQGWNVFNDRESRSQYANGSEHFRPQPTRIFFLATSTSDTNRLAGEAAANNIAGPVRRRLWRKRAYIIPASNVGPMLGKDFLRIWVFLNLPGARKPRSVEAEVETTDASEEGTVR